MLRWSWRPLEIARNVSEPFALNVVYCLTRQQIWTICP